MSALRAVLAPLDQWLVQLDRSSAPQALAPTADHTARALHAMATERALLPVITRDGVLCTDGAAAWVERVAATGPLVLCDALPRGVVDAVLAQTGWRSWCRAVLTGDDALAAPEPAWYEQAVRRAGLAAAREGVVALVPDAAHEAAAAQAGLVVLRVGPWWGDAGLPAARTPAELSVSDLRARLAATPPDSPRK